MFNTSTAKSRLFPNTELEEKSRVRVNKLRHLVQSRQKQDNTGDHLTSNNSTAEISNPFINDNRYASENNQTVTANTEVSEPEIKNEANSFGLTGSNRNQTFTLQSKFTNKSRSVDKNTFNSTSSPKEMKIDEGSDQDFDTEYVPKLISPSTLYSQFHHDFQKKAEEDQVLHVKSTGVERTKDWVSSLKTEQLRRGKFGDPLPLPYVNQTYTKSTPKSSNINNVLTLDRIEEKRNIMKSKWRHLIEQDKELIENKIHELRLFQDEGNVNGGKWRGDSSLHYTELEPNSFVGNQSVNDIDFSRTSLQKTTNILPNDKMANPVYIGKLQEDIALNTQKLDHIISILERNKAGTRLDSKLPFNTPAHIKEITFWTLCIIILLMCNIYVYYYI